MDSDIDELETCNSISYSLTYTKPLSGWSHDTVASDDELSTWHPSTSIRSVTSQNSSSKRSYSEDFPSYTPESVNHRPSNSYSSDFAGSSDYTSMVTPDASSQPITKDSADDKPPNISSDNTLSDSYATQFDSFSQTHPHTSDEYSRTNSGSVKTIISDSYSTDFDVTESVTQHSYDSDFESKSHLTDSDTLASRSTSADSYQSDFEESVTESYGSSDEVKKRDVEELKYVKAMMKAVQSNDDRTRRQAWQDIDKAAVQMKQSTENPPEAQEFIKNSLSRLKSASGEPTSIEHANSSKLSTMRAARQRHLDTVSSRQRQLLSDDHPFVHRVERLRMDNFFIGLQQRQKNLDKEILEHNEFIKKNIPPHAARMFVLPRKLRLEKETFISKLEDHQTRMNTVAMIGDIAKDLPKPTEEHEVVWQKLMNTAHRRAC